jgi:hypothetical protein
MNATASIADEGVRVAAGALPRSRRARAVAVARGDAVRRARWAWLFGAFAVAGGVEAVQTLFAFFGDESLLWFHQDFPALYAAAKLVAGGSGRLLYDTASLADAEIAAAGQPVGGTGVLAYFNPPFFAALLAPLSALPLDHAYQAWTLFGAALLAIDAWLLWRIALPLPRRWRIAVVAGFATLYPVAYGLQLGQFSLVLVTSWAAAYLLLRAGREGWAGVALAPLLIKPELLLPVATYLLWKRRWRVFSTLAPLTAAAVVASIVIIGPDAALAYPGYLLNSTTWHGDGVATNVMFDWNGIAAMWWERPAASRAGLLVVGALSLATLAAVARAWRGPLDPRTPRFAAQWMLLTLATVLVDPHLYLQDTVLIAPAAAACPHRRPVIAATLVAGWSMLALGIYPNEHLHVNAFGLYMALAATALLVFGRTAVSPCEACADEGLPDYIPPTTYYLLPLLRLRHADAAAPALDLAADEPLLHLAPPEHGRDEGAEELQRQHGAPDARHPLHPPAAARRPVEQRQAADDDHVGRAVPEELQPPAHAAPDGAVLRVAAVVEAAAAGPAPGADADAAPRAADVDALELVAVVARHRSPPAL